MVDENGKVYVPPYCNRIAVLSVPFQHGVHNDARATATRGLSYIYRWQRSRARLSNSAVTVSWLQGWGWWFETRPSFRARENSYQYQVVLWCLKAEAFWTTVSKQGLLVVLTILRTTSSDMIQMPMERLWWKHRQRLISRNSMLSELQQHLCIRFITVSFRDRLIVPVVLDPILTRRMRDHQKEGKSKIIKWSSLLTCWLQVSSFCMNVSWDSVNMRDKAVY